MGVTRTVDTHNRTGDEELPGPLAKIDEFQQSHSWLAVPIAVWRKFADDRGAKLAALISYYGFLSIFPLLIVATTVVTRYLDDLAVTDKDLAEKVLNSAVGSFLPVGSNGQVQALQLSGIALVIALLVALWSGLAVGHNMQYAMNVVYEVPRDEEPGFVGQLLRSLTLLIIVGLGLPATTVIMGFFGASNNVGVRIITQLGVFALSTLVLMAAFRRSTMARTTWREVLPGAALAALAWLVSQNIATSLLTSKVASAGNTYGGYALVIALLFWFFLLAQITLYCAELNVVLARGLWPRGLRAGGSENTKTVETVTDKDGETVDLSDEEKKEEK